jgi:hypothetical protein
VAGEDQAAAVPMKRMMFTYGCDSCGRRVDRLIWFARRDEPQECECGGCLVRKWSPTGGLQGSRKKKMSRAAGAAAEAREAAEQERASSAGSAPFHLEAKDSTFSGDWRVTGYDHVFKGTYTDCEFSANITHRREPDPET